jgi:N-acyl-D-amino-acid deacylase
MKERKMKDEKRSWNAAIVAAVLAAGLAAGVAAQRPGDYDLIVSGARVVDGSGAPARRADVAVKDGRIVRVGVVREGAAEVIRADGLIVAPGFIDVHTHADDIADMPLAENFVAMGVTTIVAGNCGGSSLEIGEALTRVRQVGPSVNFATLIGHNTIRASVMGREQRPPSPDELARMRSLVWKAMADGAVGFSTGLQYIPGAYAETGEIIELAKVAANAGGLYASHMRNEGTELEKSVEEAIRIGDAAGARVEISHLKVDSPSRWGASQKALALIDRARARGVDVRADQYVYTAASSGLAIRFPAWALEGGPEQIRERLDDGTTWLKIKGEMRQLLAERGLSDLAFATVASYSADPSLNGLTMKQVAMRLKGSDTADAQLEAARDIMRTGGASMVYHFMSDEDIVRILRHPQVGIASDSDILQSGAGVPHPRGYGNNARVLGLYVRERQVVTLPEAVRKMTSLPAQHFGFAGRGLVREGYAADLVVFDPARVADRATFEQPHAYAAGIPYVIVNGVVTIRKGEHTRARGGQVLVNRAIARSGDRAIEK